MALLGDGEATYESSSYSRFREVPKLLMDYGIVHHSFRGLYEFKKICKDFFVDLMEGDLKGDMEGKSPYLGFTRVGLSDISSIDEIRLQGDVPKMTILYDSGEEVLIVKFMVGVTHETCAGLLQMSFIEAVRARVGHIYSMYSLKSARFRSAQRMKEADDSFKPRTRNNESDWPSIVFEVGVSERLTELSQDARYWLESSPQQQTRIVILASVNKTAGTMIIERWEAEAPTLQAAAPTLQAARNVSNSNPYSRQVVPICMQTLTLERDQHYAGPPLSIPATLVFDVLPFSHGPAWGPSDFKITVHMLNMLNEMFWDGLD
ncbi:hypothetical protein KC19_11G123400 [Ceratodon purpureus]|uniref:Uncharacterized protein n=1 Tax=Ceratodon purpureus TaxID=3225 RepID=A0A8T0GDN7_CERPU|nr:hypothetical protein KC19_11G123400 [Ceratodon purpureus]